MIVWESTQPVIPVCARQIYLKGARPESEGDVFSQSDAGQVQTQCRQIPAFRSEERKPE